MSERYLERMGPIQKTLFLYFHYTRSELIHVFKCSQL